MVWEGLVVRIFVVGRVVEEVWRRIVVSRGAIGGVVALFVVGVVAEVNEVFGWESWAAS